MRYAPGVKEDAKNLAIIAGSAMLATLVTAAFFAVQLRASRAPVTSLPNDPPAADAAPARNTEARFILIGHDTRHDAHAKHHLQVVVVRTDNGKRVVTVRSRDGTSASGAQDLTESPSTH